MMDEDVEDFLAHYGVKGMKWGQRKNNLAGVSVKTNRDARKDAQEFARAKMFYGTGAGNRRKLIKTTVESKSKDPSYKAAFDHHLANQDMGKHASKAKTERRRKDVSSKTTKTARGVHRQLTGGFGSVSMASALIAGAYIGARKTGIDQVIINSAKQKMNDLSSKQNDKKNVNDWMKKNGFL
ncbi:gp023 [Rhodococcus phage ReqiPoco6]|uniref:Gp023 n=1 Tax=Rhodococcus phage ReqiPoco6 TaxID=691964 RepID=D4P7P1_9CAUD|nr:gp023 [Rhodococcus phage ReqiPoco6]ADD81021.1 gp023 [Rhodococcus phage ReqiPoco6]